MIVPPAPHLALKIIGVGPGDGMLTSRYSSRALVHCGAGCGIDVAERVQADGDTALPAAAAGGNGAGVDYA